ncbi:hypothetical protein SELMODRAFT_413284 [Selaginella moellendorffii]|uniref:Isopenicillin N synthase-like Fe(2+) 2OG dioxygenase domain-containing protein n=1 Tax=Selaginella moellendorffii TaxID=88036 RepID=D8RNY8_SELML|nr:hypothetical protein SELMODRAFT_413284 [Selaginella moellendorffii]
MVLKEDLKDRKEHFLIATENKSTLSPDLPPNFSLQMPSNCHNKCKNWDVMAILSQSRNCYDKNGDYYNFLHYPTFSDYQGQVLALIKTLPSSPWSPSLRLTWHLVVPEENSLIINFGDLIQVWTNGLYKGAVHRVVANKAQRFSFVYNYVPEGKTRIRSSSTQSRFI